MLPIALSMQSNKKSKRYKIKLMFEVQNVALHEYNDQFFGYIAFSQKPVPVKISSAGLPSPIRILANNFESRGFLDVVFPTRNDFLNSSRSSQLDLETESFHHPTPSFWISSVKFLKNN